MKHKTRLFIDQWGNKYFARSIRELRQKVGGGRIGKMYQDKVDGTVVHVGYVVGKYWCDEWARVEKKALTV